MALSGPQLFLISQASVYLLHTGSSGPASVQGLRTSGSSGGLRGHRKDRLQWRGGSLHGSSKCRWAQRVGVKGLKGPAVGTKGCVRLLGSHSGKGVA